MKLRTHTEKKRGNWGEFNVLYLFVCKDFGLETLGDLVEKTTFPWLMSNVIDNETGRPLADGTVSWNVKTVSGRNDKDGHAGRSLAEGMCLWIDYVASWNRRGGMLTFDCLTFAKFLTPWMLPLIGLPFDGVGWPQDCTLWPIYNLYFRSSTWWSGAAARSVLLVWWRGSGWIPWLPSILKRSGFWETIEKGFGRLLKAFKLYWLSNSVLFDCSTVRLSLDSHLGC